MLFELPIHYFQDVLLKYDIPEHLRGVENTEQQRRADLALLDNELKKHSSSLEEKISSGVIWRRGFPGMILDVRRIDHSSYVEIITRPIHPHRADLAYKKDRTLPRNAFPLTVNALLENAENNFVLGIRGGLVESEKIAIIPGGHADYTNPVIESTLETFRSEFKEELGYEFDGEVFPLCVFTNRDTNGINVFYRTKTKLGFPEILENWKSAKDRGEHNSLFRASYQTIRQLAETGKTIVEGRECETTPFLQDCFNLISE